MAAPQWDKTKLEARVRSRVDMVNSDFVTTDEVQAFLEAGWNEFYGIVCGEFEDAVLTKYTMTTVAGTSVYPVPPTLKKLRALRMQNEYFLSPISLREVERYDWQNGRGKPRYYWLYGDYAATLATAEVFQLLATPDNVYSIDIFYVPSISLADISGGKPLAYLAGWDEFVVLCAAIKCKDKEESDVSVLMAEKAQLLETIKKNWTPLDTSEAPRVVELTRQSMRNALYSYDPDEWFS